MEMEACDLWFGVGERGENNMMGKNKEVYCENSKSKYSIFSSEKVRN